MSIKSIRITGIRVDRKNDESDFLVFDSNDVYYVYVKNEVLVFHTRYGDFYWVNTLEGIKHSWRDYGFLSLDTVNVVNMNNIDYFDSETRRVYFKDGSFTSVSGRRVRLVKHLRKTT